MAKDSSKKGNKGHDWVERHRRADVRSRPVADGVPAGREPGADVRPARRRAGHGRPDARRAKGAARRGRRLPRPRTRPDPRQRARSSAGSTTSSSSSSRSSSSSTARPRTCSARSSTSSASPRGEFDRDIAQIRRLTPGPVRRTIRRVPALIGDGRRTPSSNSVSGRACGPGSTGRIPSREGHPDEGRAQARQERGDEDRGRRLRHELPHPAAARRARGRRRVPRLAARRREPRGQAEARARGGRDRARPASPARP